MTQPNTVPEAEFDLDSIFDNAGGGSGAPSFAWPLEVDPRKADRMVPVIGGSVQGEITDVYVTVVKDPNKNNEPKLDRKGRQQPQVNLTLQTTLRNWEGCKSIPVDKETNQPLPASEDSGLRRIYVKYRMLEAVAKAIQASEQKKGGPRKGAKLAVKVTALQYDAQNIMKHPLPDYEARYVAPVEASPADDMFNQAAAAAASVPAQQAPAASSWSTTADEAPF